MNNGFSWGISSLFLGLIIIWNVAFGEDSFPERLGEVVIGISYIAIFAYAVMVLNRVFHNRKCYKSAIDSDSVFYTHFDTWTGKKSILCTYHRPLTEEEKMTNNVY